MTGETRVVQSRTSLRAAYAGLAPGTKRVLVPTMGALHDGHAALMRAGRVLAGPGGHVTASIFVNPTQFAAHEDLEKYPRSLEVDVDVCAREGVDLVFAPTVEGVYRGGDPTVTVDPGALGTLLEGAVRPGHFRGVLTVVQKLLHLTGADVLLLGEKDYQQLVLVKRMVFDLDLPVEVVGVPTVRAEDGLALSSRNAYLSADERRLALTVPHALDVGSGVARSGGTARDIVSSVQSFLDEHDGIVTDYAVVTDPMLGAPPEEGEARLLVAVRIGTTRLLDNIPLVIGGDA
ncbi:MAG: pantoate--beta-alanine ligase [Candidatus Nanopelagicales bacterium]